MKNKIFVSVVIAATLGITSCSDFLDQGPKTALTQEQVFKDLDNLEPTIMGLYTQWRNIHKDRGNFVLSLGTDESQEGAYQANTEADQSGLDKYNGYLSPTNNAITSQWDSRWLIVSSAAQAIYALEAITTEPGRRDELMGEACFIRAALNFDLVQYWGEIPVIDLNLLSSLGTGRQSLDVVYANIISDLEKSVQFLPPAQSDKRRATKGAAQALLGKVYLYARAESGVRDYNKAITYFEQVISGGYQLVTNYNDLYDATKTNTSESIYEFQFTNIWPDNNQTQWQTGSRAAANMNQYCMFGGYDLMLPTEYCYRNIVDGGLWEEGDLRRDASIRYDFTYFGQTPEIPSGFGGDELNPHIKKYEDQRTDGVMSFWYSGKNIFYLRLADIYLCYAECLNETGKTSEAVNIVNNKIRSRAWGGTLPDSKKWSNGMSVEEFRVNIMNERMRELCFEGWRKMDLMRSGNLIKLVKERNKYAKASGTIAEFHNKYPIPLTEIKQNEDIEEDDQNPGYTN
jgi:tetratricopeptide (TPR) repeat protein